MSVVKDNFSMVTVNDNFKDNTITVSKKNNINMIIIKEIFKDYFSTVTIIFDEMIDVSKEVIAFTFFQMVAEVIIKIIIITFMIRGLNMIIIISIIVQFLGAYPIDIYSWMDRIFFIDACADAVSDLMHN